MIFGLVGNPYKRAVRRILPKYIQWLQEREIPHLVSSQFSRIKGIDPEQIREPEALVDEVDILLSFGGDGTLLRSVHMLKGRETPVVGVNLGGMGYLADVGTRELFNRTEDIISGNWRLEKRMVLETRLENGDEENLGPWYGLNDVIIDKGGYSRMILLRTTINGSFLNNYRADGLLISTPTGSTGYSLSAGGPIIEPTVKVIIVHPLNPHSLSNRPLVIADDKEIRVEASTHYDHVTIAVDGDVVCTPAGKHTLIVNRASFDACLVTFEGRFFYEVLRQKLGWGDS